MITSLFLTMDLILFILELLPSPSHLFWLLVHHLSHLLINFSTTFYHYRVLQQLEDVTSVKHHLMTKLLNKPKRTLGPESRSEVTIPKPTFKPSPLRRPTKSFSFEETTRERAAREENRRKLLELSSNEGLYDSLTCYLALVCCVLYLPLVLGERTIFSVYFLTLFTTAWFSVFSYCLQEQCWHILYICLGWSGRIRYRKGMERTVSFNEMIQCMEFDEAQVSPGPLNSRITFVDAISRQPLHGVGIKSF